MEDCSESMRYESSTPDRHLRGRIWQAVRRPGQRRDAVGNQPVHGTIFEFIRNSSLDARNYFDKGSIPPLRSNQFGGALGGPLKKVNCSCSVTMKAFGKSLSQSSVAVVPDDQARLGLLPDASRQYSPVPNLNSAMLPYMSFWPRQMAGN